MKLIFHLILLLMMWTPCKGQIVTDTFGTNGNGTPGFAPISYLSSTKIYTIFKPNELAAAGIVSGSMIYGIAYYKTNSAYIFPSAAASLELKMRCGSLDTSVPLSWASTSWPYVVNSYLSAGFVSWMQYVNGANLNVPANPGWIPFMLDAPFVYTGGTLEVYTDWQAASGSTNIAPEFATQHVSPQISIRTSYPLGGAVNYVDIRPSSIIYHSENPAPCTGTPTGGYIAGISTPCPNDSFSLYLVNPSAGPGISYQWQSAPVSSTSWTNIAGATLPSLKYASAGPIQFRCMVSCASSSQNAPSSAWTLIPTPYTIDSIAVTVTGGNMATFYAYVSDSAGSNGFSWEFGDGNTGGGNPVQHQYTADSNFTVRLVALGGCNYDTAYTTVTVGCAGGNTFQNLASATADTNICIGETATLQMNNPAPPAYDLQWQYRGGFGVYYDIAGANGPTVNVSPSAITVYRHVATCPLSSNKKISNEVTIVPTPAPVAGSIQAVNTSGSHYDFSAPGAANAQDFYWDFGNGHSSTLQSPSHHYPWAGNYTVTLVVTNTVNGCSDTATTQISILTSMEHLSAEEQVEIYPNPAQEQVWIRLGGQSRNVSVTLTDISGRKLGKLYNGSSEGLSEAIRLPQLVPGLYFLSVIVDGTPVKLKKLHVY